MSGPRFLYEGVDIDTNPVQVTRVEGLGAFRADTPTSPAAKAASRKKVWIEPTMTDFPTEDCFIFAVDQSLGALGLVYITLVKGVLEVQRAVTLRGAASASATGWEKELQEFENLRQQLLSELPGCHGHSLGWILYHEAPPVGGGKRIQTHSSLLGAAALRAAAHDQGIPWGRMIRSQDWKKILFDIPGADKPAIKRHLLPLAERLGVQGMELITNESQRDALGVGLASMIRSAT